MKLPHGVSLTCPEARIGGRSRRQKLRDERWTAEKQNEWNQQAPSDNASGKVQRRQPRADDVANSQIRGADRREPTW